MHVRAGGTQSQGTQEGGGQRQENGRERKEGGGKGTKGRARGERRAGRGEGPREPRGGPAPPLTTSSMTGSGLAASSCSFTFSSTRGRKTTRQACGRGPATLATWATLRGTQQRGRQCRRVAGRPWAPLPPPLPSPPASQMRQPCKGSSKGRTTAGLGHGGPAAGSQLQAAQPRLPVRKLGCWSQPPPPSCETTELSGRTHGMGS